MNIQKRKKEIFIKKKTLLNLTMFYKTGFQALLCKGSTATEVSPT